MLYPVSGDFQGFLFLVLATYSQELELLIVFIYPTVARQHLLENPGFTQVPPWGLNPGPS
jgi:hypothetical protein